MINFPLKPPTNIKIDFENNVCFSNETIEFENGLKYCGQVKNGLPDGIGKVLSSHGEIIYDGEFVKGLREGNGTCYYQKSGSVYKGAFSNGLRHGYGEMRYFSDSDDPKECVYRGFFEHGEKSDTCAFIKWREDCQCEGSWIADQMQGESVISFKLKNKYNQLVQAILKCDAKIVSHLKDV